MQKRFYFLPLLLIITNLCGMEFEKTYLDLLPQDLQKMLTNYLSPEKKDPEQLDVNLEHGGCVTAFAWSPSGKKIAVGSLDGLRIYTRQGEREEYFCEGNVLAVDWGGPKGDNIAVSCKKAFVMAFVMIDVKMKKEKTLRDKGDVRALTWLSDGSGVVLGCNGLDYISTKYYKSIKICTPEGDLITEWELDRNISDIRSLHCLPDGNLIAASCGCSVVIYTKKGTRLRRLEGKFLGLGDRFGWSYDEKYEAFCKKNSETDLYRVGEGQGHKSTKLKTGLTNILCSCCWSPGGYYMAVGGARLIDGKIVMSTEIYNADTGRMEGKLENAGTVNQLRWSPDGECLAIGIGEGGAPLHIANIKKLLLHYNRPKNMNLEQSCLLQFLSREKTPLDIKQSDKSILDTMLDIKQLFRIKENKQQPKDKASWRLAWALAKPEKANSEENGKEEVQDED